MQGFRLFSSSHLITLGIISAVAVFYAFVGRHPRFKKWNKPLGWILAVVLLGNELIFIGGAIAKGLWSYTWGLPLQLCDLAIFAVAFSLFKHQRFIWELAYFWGLGGTLQAVLTPDLGVAFPDYIFIKFFLTHGCILVGVVYLSAGLGRPISLSSVRRVWITTNIYAFFVAVFNRLFATNYLYLCEKPARASIIDYMGPWPQYILGLEGILIVSLFLYYLPYYVAEKFQRR